MKSSLGVLAAVVMLLTSTDVSAQAGRTAGNPFQESSAGRAWKRITFGAIDCNLATAASDFCPNDAFSTSGLFVNGTYQELRHLYGGEPLGTANVAEFLSNRVFTQSQTFPNASTASGFTFSWQGGPTPVRDSDLFGPLFGNRARTNGAKQLSATLSMQQLRWVTVDGSKVRNGESGLAWGDPDYLVSDGIQYGYVGRCLMDINTSVASLSANYGITDRWDVSATLPIVRTTIEGSNEFLDFARFPDGSLSVDVADTAFEPQGRFYVKGSSTGIGDVSIGTTYAIVKKQKAALAVSGRVDLGTGSLEDMTGTGEMQVRGGIAGSWESDRIAPHASLSYSAGNDVLFDELMYIVGADFKAIPDRLTLSVEIVGRSLFGVQGFERGELLGSVTSPRSNETFEVRSYTAQRDDLNLLFGTIGGKVRISGQLLGSLYVLIPTGNDGLQAQKPTLNFGFNYAF
jgi:hypothetical protein